MSKPRRRITDKLLAEWFLIDAWTGSRGFSLPMEPRGVYREMLTQAWRRGAKLPNDPEEIRRIIGCSEKEWRRCWPKVQPFWIVEGDTLVNVTQVVVYLQSKEAADNSKARAEAGGKANAQAQREKRLSGPYAPAQDVPSVSVSEPLSEASSERDARPPAKTGSGAMAGSLPRDHVRHKACGRVCLHETQFEQFVRKLGGDPAAAAMAVKEWARETLDTWELPPLMNKPIQGTTFQWWDARWEEWQGSPKAVEQPRASQMPSYTPWDCPHTPPCPHRAACAVVAARPSAS